MLIMTFLSLSTHISAILKAKEIKFRIQMAVPLPCADQVYK